jgi:hypothetical protein
VERPRDEPEDNVSNESVPSSVPCSDDGVDGITGTGGTLSYGASSPFLVVVEADRDFGEKRSLALGADATRRINRGNAPIDLEDNGPPCRCPNGERELNDACDGWAVWDPPCGERPRTASCACFSDLVRVRDFGKPAERTSVELG